MHEQAHKKVREGTVVSTKMDKTIVVQIERLVTHPLYKKVIRRRRKVLAHAEPGTCKEGDFVRIEETRPLSRRKRWRFVETLREAP